MTARARWQISEALLLDGNYRCGVRQGLAGDFMWEVVERFGGKQIAAGYTANFETAQDACMAAVRKAKEEERE